MISKCICLCHCLCLCICLCHCLFFGQIMSPHHSDQMSQRSKVSRIALWRCSLNVFVSVIVFVFVFVPVIVFFFGQFMSPHHSNQRSQRSSVSWVALCMSISKVLWVSEWVTEWQGHLLSCSGQLKITSKGSLPMRKTVKKADNVHTGGGGGGGGGGVYPSSFILA